MRQTFVRQTFAAELPVPSDSRTMFRLMGLPSPGHETTLQPLVSEHRTSLPTRKGFHDFQRMGAKSDKATKRWPVVWLQLCHFREFWSGRRGSNPRPRPWQGRALPLSYTRIRRLAAIARRQLGELCQMRPANATAQAGGRIGRVNQPCQAIGPEISPKTAGRGSADCKLGSQAPIRAGPC